MPISSDDSRTVRCPACRAVQAWSDTCRRCKCDLRLLRAAAATRNSALRRCLHALRAGRVDEALRYARRYHALRPDAESARLLAACALQAGDWATAAATAAAIAPDA